MRPSRSSRLATNLAVLMPMAKQIPCAGRMVAVFTPTTRPAESTSGPPELPGIQRGVGLDHVVDQATGIRPQRPAQSADHARRHRRLESVGRADRDHDLADAQALRIAESGGGQARVSSSIRESPPGRWRDHRRSAWRACAGRRPASRRCVLRRARRGCW